MEDKKDQHFTFILIPHRGARALSLKLRAKLVYFGAGVLCVALFFALASLVFSFAISRRLVHYQFTLWDNAFKNRQIKSFASEKKNVEQKIEALLQKDKELRQLLGLPCPSDRRAVKQKLLLPQSYDKDKPLTLSEDLRTIKLSLKETEKSQKEIYSRAMSVFARLSSTPSTWPLYGQVVSSVGYRCFPWRGFHSGLDISGHYGVPIRATASGTVVWAGWRTGYGRTVIIEHGFGFSTFYGHASRLAVSVNQKVIKGQIICYVGASGYATGPHLHYEVRRAGKPVNPMAYLNLNVFTASRLLGI